MQGPASVDDEDLPFARPVEDGLDQGVVLQAGDGADGPAEGVVRSVLRELQITGAHVVAVLVSEVGCRCSPG